MNSGGCGGGYGAEVLSPVIVPAGRVGSAVSSPWGCGSACDAMWGSGDVGTCGIRGVTYDAGWLSSLISVDGAVCGRTVEADVGLTNVDLD